MSKVKVAVTCKLMPYYRLGIFQKLTENEGKLEFSFFGDTKEQGGIKQIPYSFASKPKGENIRWIKTKNFFYKPERLLWQTGIISEIFKDSFRVFIFEGAIAHYPIWLFAFLCRLRKRKVLFWTHGDRGLDKGLKKFLRKILFKGLGNGLLLYGNHQKNIMVKDGYHEERLFVIYNSLQPSKQFELLEKISLSSIIEKKDRLFSNPNYFTLIFIGRLVSSKGIIDIVTAIHELKNDNILVNCIFIGTGPEKEIVSSFCKIHNIENQVFFAGEVYEEKNIAPYFAMADLMVSPGNVGLNCVHSLAYGVPVMTHNNYKYQNPEVEAIIEGVSGTFFEYGNFHDFTLRLKSWIKTNHTKKSLREDCQNIIKTTYNPENQAQCIIKAIKATLND